MKGQNIAYIRVSTIEQNEARQIESLKKFSIDRYFIDKASGSNTNREQLTELLNYIREGDVVYVSELSRLGRSVSDLMELVKTIENKGASFISAKEQFDTSTPSGRLQFTMLAAIAEFERELILERQREGVAIAKKLGKFKGREKIQIDNIGDYYEAYQSRRISKAAIAKELGISRNTLDRLFSEYAS